MTVNKETTGTTFSSYHTNKRTFNCKARLLCSICFISISLLAAVSCSPNNKPEETADSFLKAYLATDYKQAISYCTPQLSKYLMESVKELENLDHELKAKIIESTTDLSTKINSLEKNDKGDSVKINYSILKTNPVDSTIKVEIKNHLYLVKENKIWKVASLN